MINMILLGKIKVDKEKCPDPEHSENFGNVECMTGKQFVAVFGLASSTMSIIYVSTAVCCIYGLNIIIPGAYGKKEYQLCGAYMNNMIVFITFLFAPLLLPLQYIHHLFQAMG